jgi:hypothetical protein
MFPVFHRCPLVLGFVMVFTHPLGVSVENGTLLSMRRLSLLFYCQSCFSSMFWPASKNVRPHRAVDSPPRNFRPFMAVSSLWNLMNSHFFFTQFRSLRLLSINSHEKKKKLFTLRFGFWISIYINACYSAIHCLCKLLAFFSSSSWFFYLDLMTF